MPEFLEFPKWMTHPHERPAVISDDYERGERQALMGYQAAPGRSRSFPPVQVNDADQQAYYEAKGYVPGNPDGREAAIRAPLPQDYVHREFPRYVNGAIEHDPNAPVPPGSEYPKWVTPPGGDPKIVKSRAEEIALLGESTPPQPSAAELEFASALAAAEADYERGQAPIAAAASLRARRGRPARRY